MRTILLAMGFSMMVGCGGGSTDNLDSVYEKHDGVYFCVLNCCETQTRVTPCPPKDVIALPVSPIRITDDEAEFNALMERELDAKRAKISANQ